MQSGANVLEQQRTIRQRDESGADGADCRGGAAGVLIVCVKAGVRLEEEEVQCPQFHSRGA